MSDHAPLDDHARELPFDGEAILWRFEQAWRTNTPPDLEHFLPQPAAAAARARNSLLVELVKIDLEYRWKTDTATAAQLCVEDYLNRFPELAVDRPCALDLLAEEYRVRCRSDVRPNHGEYFERFPNQATELPALFAAIDADLIREFGGRAVSPDVLDRPTIAPDSVAATSVSEQRAALPPVAGYEILAVLGRGGMGVVYKARELKLRRVVALKMILAGGHAGADPLARFQAEAHAVAKLSHPNIVPIYEVGNHDGLPFLALEYLDGGSLDKKLAGTPQNPRAAAELVRTLALAMHAAHQAGVVHRDLKPGNILLTKDGVPKITDFGLAKQLDSSVANTQSGSILGTPSYMAPEQAAGKSREVGPASDVYALGAILYEMLTGRPPFKAENAWDTIVQVLAEEPIPPSRLRPKLPRDLETICLKCLNKEAGKRYAAACDLAEDLRRFQQDESIVARPASVWERTRKWQKRHPATTALFAAGVVAAALLVAIVVNYTLQLRLKVDEADEQRRIAQGHQKVADQERRTAEQHRREAVRERDVAENVQQEMGLTFTRQELAQRRHAKARETLLNVPESRRGWEWRHLQLLTGSGPHFSDCLGAHDWGVMAGCVSPNGKWFATSGQDGWVGAWDTATRTPKVMRAGLDTFVPAALRLHVTNSLNQRPVEGFAGICWIDEGRVLAAASLQMRGILWDLAADKIEVLVRHDRPLYAVGAAEEGSVIAFGDDQGRVLLHDRADKQTRTTTLKPSAVTALATLPRLGWIVGQEDGTVSLLDLQGRPQPKAHALSGPIWALALDPTGTTLAVGCELPSVLTIAIDKLQWGEPKFDFALPRDIEHAPAAVHAVAFSADGQSLLAGDDLGHVTCWERRTRQVRFEIADQVNPKLKPGQLVNLPLPQRRRFAALHVAADGAGLYTAGQDTLVKRWTIPPTPGVTLLRTPSSKPRVRFDPTEPELLWVGGADGMLRLWDSRTDVERHAVAAHVAGVAWLDVATQANLAATCGRDRVIRFWKRAGARLEECRKPIEHTAALRCVALSPRGDRVAGYDIDNQVQVWDVETGRDLELPQLFALNDRAAVGGLVAFNADGKLLAVAGPGQTFRIVPIDAPQDTENWDTKYAAGGGGTAIAWHPVNPAQLLGGDTMGRVTMERQWPGPRLGRTHQSGLTIIGLTFTPDGGRYAVADADNQVTVIDHQWLGVMLSLKPTHPAPGTDLRFDARGRRLALVHEDGRITIWESTLEPPPLVDLPARAWSPKVLWSGPMLTDHSVRRAVALDGADRVWMLRLVDDAEADKVGGVTQARVWLMRETAADVHQEDLGTGAPVMSWHRLLVDGDKVWAAVHRRESVSTGRTYLHQRTRAAAVPPNAAHAAAEPLYPEAMNWGYDVQLVPDRAGKPSAIHFAWSTNNLYGTWWTGDAWTSAPLGRMGDGKRSLTALRGADGRIHVTCVPFRFERDPHPAVYSIYAGPPWREELREIVPLPPTQQHAELIGMQDGQPLISTRHNTSPETLESLVLRRGKDGVWSRSPPLVTRHQGCMTSELCVHPRGTVYCALYDQKTGALTLASNHGAEWRVEPVAKDADPCQSGELALRCDSRGQPVILFAGNHGAECKVRVFRVGAGGP